MTFIRRNEGIALVTSLMLTLISLTITMALLYMVTQNIMQSAQFKKYHTALDAAYGGTEVVVKDILPIVLQNYDNATLATTVANSFTNIQLQVFDQTCLKNKLLTATSSWGSCSNDPNPKKTPDMSFLLQADTGNAFVVYSKIIDTTPGNSDTSGLQLEGSGVAESSSLLTPQQFPYIYRLEIQGERQNNPTAQATLDVLYAY